MDDTAMEEPAMPDTAMLGADLAANLETNLDDLFGEGSDGLAAEALRAPLNSMPLSPEVVLRVMQNQARGCRTRLVWSSTGSIAHIKSKGQSIAFRALRRDRSDGSWSMSGDSEYPIDAAEGSRWEHIQFSNLGTDLAAVTDSGHVHVYSLTGPLGRMQLAPMDIEPQEGRGSDGKVVVGLHWLPVAPAEYKFPYISPATKHGEKWTARMHQRNPNDAKVHHAVDHRSALLYASRDATLTLMYQIESTWHAVESKLEGLHCSRDLLSHAAMCEDGDSILLVTLDLGRRFRLYRITIAWNATQVSRPEQNSSITAVAPVLTVERSTVLDHVSAKHANWACLSQLRIIPAIPAHATEANAFTVPTILAIFTHARSNLDLTQPHQDAYSVITRWHIETTIPTLHHAFAKLKGNGPIAVPQTSITILRRQEDIMTNKLVLNVESLYFNTMLAFAGSDGTVEFRDRITMASIEPLFDSTSVSSLPQSGFEHAMDDEHFTCVAMSGDGSALVTMGSEGKLHCKLMALRYTWHPIMVGGGLIEAGVMCLARQYAILCATSVSADETLALLPPDLSAEMRSLFVRQVLDMLGRSTILDISMQDVGRQNMIVVREALLSKAISAQLVLGFKPGTAERTAMGKNAVAYLNMRLVGVAIAQSMANSQVASRPDLLVALSGLCKWGSDLLVYVASTLHALHRRLGSGSTKAANEIFDEFVADKGNPVIYFLLCTFSRVYLRLLATCIVKYLSMVSKAIPNARTVADRQQLQDAWDRGTLLPFKCSEFEVSIAELDTAIRGAYIESNISAERRAEIEVSLMLCDRPTPEELHSVLKTFAETILPNLMKKLELSKLYFWDTSWLGIESSPNEYQLSYDIIRKMPLRKGMKVRTCKRCGAKMEDYAPEKAREMSPVLAQLGRHCVCGSYWVVD